MLPYLNMKKKILCSLKSAFPHTVPIMAGFLFLGMSYGIFARSKGLPPWLPTLTSVAVFGGSLEFVGVSLLTSAFSPIQAFLMGLMVQARHLFYGVSMLEKYKSTGNMKPYLVYGLCDETFSINYTATPSEKSDRVWFMFFVTLLNHLYWITGATVGSLIGSIFPFSTEGLDFVMTAMFAVIFLEQLLKEKKHYTSMIGLASTALCLIIFGKESFLIPSMILILTLLLAFSKTIEKRGGLE